MAPTEYEYSPEELKALAQQINSESEDAYDPYESIYNDPTADALAHGDTETENDATTEANVTSAPVTSPVSAPTAIPTAQNAVATQQTPVTATTQSTTPKSATITYSSNTITRPKVELPTSTEKSPQQIAYEKAVADKKAVDTENAKSFRDLLDMYKPETPDEKAKRERMERTRQNIVGFSDMASALGNLFTATSSDNGRAVKTTPMSEGLNANIEKERAKIKERDAKGIQLRNQYIAMRKKMADENVASTWQAYKQSEAQKQLRAKNYLEAMKLNATEQREWAKMRFNEEKERNLNAYRDGLLGVKKAALAAKKAGSENNYVNVPVKDGSQIIKINKTTLSSPVVQGALESLLPLDYFSKDDQTKLATARKNGDGDMYADVMMNYIGKYLREGGIVLPDSSLDSDKNKETERWNTMMDILTAISEGDSSNIRPTLEGWNQKPNNFWQSSGLSNSGVTDPKYNIETLTHPKVTQ